jgi:hypothetical protein
MTVFYFFCSGVPLKVDLKMTKAPVYQYRYNEPSLDLPTNSRTIPFYYSQLAIDGQLKMARSPKFEVVHPVEKKVLNVKFLFTLSLYEATNRA